MFIVMYQSLRPEEMEFLSRWQIVPGEIYERRDSQTNFSADSSSSSP